MRSKVAEELSAELQADVLALSIDERIRLALELGDRAVRLYAEAEGISSYEARRVLMKNSQKGRRPSRVASE
ncbi:MAG TPA: hypothetical protein VF713_07560 [Thermoanaerobaculia bacterium]